MNAIFNEESLLNDVEQKFGKHGAHAEVLGDVLRRLKRAEKAVETAHRVMLYRGWHTLLGPSLEVDAWNEVEAAYTNSITIRP